MARFLVVSLFPLTGLFATLWLVRFEPKWHPMMHTNRFWNAVMIALAGTGLCAAMTREPERNKPGETPAPPVVLQEEDLHLPGLPPVRLAAIPGFDDDPAYMRSIAIRAEELAVRAGQSTDDLARRTDLLLAAANLILAHELEPPCIRRLLGIADEKGAQGGKECRAALDRSDGLLAKAEASIKELRGGTHDLPNAGKPVHAGTPVYAGKPGDGWLEESSERLETLQAFSLAFRAYLVPVGGKEAAREARRAASRLAPLLEHPSRAVAAAARLWQACLRHRDEDPARALSALEFALVDPSPESMPYAFFGRLLRCRSLAKHGGFAAALALLMQIEERCTDWLADSEGTEDAMRAAQLVRMQIMADWHRHLSGAQRVSQRRWCVEHIATLSQEAFGDAGDVVLRLSRAIPIVAPIPELKPPSP